MSGRTLSGLLAHTEREARIAEKRLLVLRFLREEIWSSAENLGLLLRLSHRQNIHSTLVALERMEIVRRATVPVVGRRLTLWGITAHGQGLAAADGEEVFANTFEPSKVPTSVAVHILDVQRLRLAAEASGWLLWQNGDRIERWTAGKKRPDAWATDPAGRRVAVECERTLKSVKRYGVILGDWLQAIRQGQVNRVIWVSPSVVIADRVRRILTSFSSVRVAGQLVPIPPDRFENLFFCDYERWPHI